MNHFQSELPPITLTRGDAEKLTRLADRASGPQAGDFLAREIDRAKIVTRPNVCQAWLRWARA
ncbi:hypothetical protein [Pseudorhodoplanes sp.]|uniref:hypothetical protein n=1 Tax=Pseudorhodoplanes sp. TaxID=1934341 RepID=UPI00391D044D